MHNFSQRPGENSRIGRAGHGPDTDRGHGSPGAPVTMRGRRTQQPPSATTTGPSQAEQHAFQLSQSRLNRESSATRAEFVAPRSATATSSIRMSAFLHVRRAPCAHRDHRCRDGSPSQNDMSASRNTGASPGRSRARRPRRPGVDERLRRSVLHESSAKISASRSTPRSSSLSTNFSRRQMDFRRPLNCLHRPCQRRSRRGRSTCSMITSPSVPSISRVQEGRLRGAQP